MIEDIEFIKYKRLESINIPIGYGVSAIMGTNGTCKSSLLHVISNSYKEIPTINEFLNDVKCIKAIRGINQLINPKIESLNKGDKKYNDPAPAIKGPYYKCHYSDGSIIEFRKHNQKSQNRYRIIPTYSKGSQQSLPYGLVMYLGLSRLSTYGEYQDEESIKSVAPSLLLPQDYQNEITDIYKSFTQYEITELNYEKMGEIKKRGQFSTTKDGNDSNTISAGEDNLMIILTALYSIKYFCESLQAEHKDIPAILLIDEFDATLHPEFQVKLIELFNNICLDFPNVSIVFTSHSLSIFPECKERGNNIIYLKDDFSSISLLENPDEHKIKAMLDNKLNRDYYKNKQVPILVEDEQARDFLNLILSYLKSTIPYCEYCKDAISHFKIVDAQFSCETLKTLFVDSGIDRVNLPMIGIVDGDSSSLKNLNRSLISLPGSSSPEEIVFELCKTIPISDGNDIRCLLKRLETEFSMTGKYIMTNLIPEINEIDNIITEKKNKGERTKGLRRELNKKVYLKNRDAYLEMFKFWINDEANKKDILAFYKDLRSCFYKISEYYGISSSLWKADEIAYIPSSDQNVEQLNTV